MKNKHQTLGNELFELRGKIWELVRLLTHEPKKEISEALDDVIEKVKVGHHFLYEPPVPEYADVMLYGVKEGSKHEINGWYRGYRINNLYFAYSPIKGDSNTYKIHDVKYFFFMPMMFVE